MTICKTVYIQNKPPTIHTSYSANNTVPTDIKLSSPCFK